MKNVCNHDLNSDDKSLIFIKKSFMIHPRRIDCWCPVCKKAFRFIRDEEGNYSEIDKK